MEEEQRDMKAHKAYYDMLDFVANAQQGIPKVCPCGSITKQFVDEEDTYDYLPGKRYFICKDYQIVENERNGYTQYDTSEFEEGDSSRSSQVDMSYSTDMPSNLGNMLGVRSHVRDRRIHEQLKYDLIENIWNKFGNDEEV
ncbi:hypothetical protein YC2023_081468 [Brassica napus]